MNIASHSGSTLLMEVARIGNLDCVKLLLRFEAKINIDDARFTELEINPGYGEEIDMILFAAGESSAKLAEYFKPQKVTNPGFLIHHQDVKLQLKHICREAIRNHLLKLDPHTHLFGRVPRLGLPAALTDYQLFNMSIEEKNGDVLSESESESECESESEYRSGTLNSNTVNSKFHLIRSFFEIFARFLSFHV